jgi:hypothetical protein
MTSLEGDQLGAGRHQVVRLDAPGHGRRLEAFVI